MAGDDPLSSVPGARPPMTALLPQYIYEYRKGVRRLFLFTMTVHEAHAVCRRLERETGIAVHVQAVGESKRNVFFGRRACIEVVRRIVDRPLCALTPEEDFIIGTLLGYDADQQCERFVKRQGLARRPDTDDCPLPEGCGREAQLEGCIPAPAADVARAA